MRAWFRKSADRVTPGTSDRIDDGTGVVPGLQEFGFGDSEGGEGSVGVEMESAGIPRLAIGQAGDPLPWSEFCAMTFLR